MLEQLQDDKRNLETILERAKEMVIQFDRAQSTMAPGRLIADTDLMDLPGKGTGALSSLAHFGEQYSGLLANSAGPRYFGFVTGGSTPAALAGDWLVSGFDQNACGSHDSIAPHIERQTIHLMRQLFGLDHGYFGTFVTGATMSNFTALAMARQWIGEQLGCDFSEDGFEPGLVNVVSGTPHSSVLKALSMSGIGRKRLKNVATIQNREAIDVTALSQYLSSNPGPHIVIANAGTVNTVDFDDLHAIGQLKKKFDFWLHVDAAFGGFAACSPRYARYMNGINLADSITIDAHKWLNVPYDAGMVFSRHPAIQLRVFRNSASYLGDPEASPDYFHYTPENSRRFRALPAWFTLLSYGAEGYREIIERNCDAARWFGEQLSNDRDFTLLAPVRMNVVCFTLSRKDVTWAEIQSLLQRVRDDGRVFFTPTRYQGVPAIRAAVSNWQTTREDLDIAHTVLKELVVRGEPAVSR